MSNETFTDSFIEHFVMRKDINYILYDDMVVLMNNLAEEFPELISITTFGQSYEKREMRMLTMTTNPNAVSSMMLTGAHHSRELSSI